MDILALSLAVKKALAEIGIGKTMEPGILEWDGDITGLESLRLSDTVTLYKISDRFISAKEIKGFTVKTTDIEFNKYIASDEISFDSDADMGLVIASWDDFMVMSFQTDIENGQLKKGTYTSRIFDDESGTWFFIGAIHGVLTETIHPIDPKFIPGAVLPAVELSTTFAVGASCTEEESNLLTAAWESGAPVVIKCDIKIDDTTIYTGVSFAWGRVELGNTYAFIAAFGTQLFQIYTLKEAKDWGFNIS